MTLYVAKRVLYIKLKEVGYEWKICFDLLEHAQLSNHVGCRHTSYKKAQFPSVSVWTNLRCKITLLNFFVDRSVKWLELQWR